MSRLGAVSQLWARLRDELRRIRSGKRFLSKWTHVPVLSVPWFAAVCPALRAGALPSQGEVLSPDSTQFGGAARGLPVMLTLLGCPFGNHPIREHGSVHPECQGREPPSPSLLKPRELIPLGPVWHRLWDTGCASPHGPQVPGRAACKGRPHSARHGAAARGTAQEALRAFISSWQRARGWRLAPDTGLTFAIGAVPVGACAMRDTPATPEPSHETDVCQPGQKDKQPARLSPRLP